MIKRNRKGQFIKGISSWNKGTKGVMKSWNKGKKCPQLSGKNNAMYLKENRDKVSNAKKGILHLNQRGENHGQWNGGRQTTRGGYILIYSPKHPFNSKKYVFEHRLVAEKKLGRYLTKQELIHHINKIKNDNRPENLYMFPSNSAHLIYHNLKNKPKLISNLIRSIT